MFTVAGESFNSRTEYELALKDEEIINALKSRYDVSTVAGIRGIYFELKSISFKTIVGDKFDDEIYDLYEKVKSGNFVDNETNTKAIVKKGKEKRSKHSKSNNNELLNMDEKTKKLVLKEIKKRNRLRTTLVIVLLLVAASSLGYFGVYYNNSLKVSKTANEWSSLKETEFPDVIKVEQVLKKEYSEDVVIPEILDEYKILYNKNKSLIGWVKIDDTIIDYPVMQTVDNEYYLKYNFNQQKDANGAIFLDTNCDIVLGNTNWILYGHHMNNGKMFSSLIKYANKDFYEKHKIIHFDTIYEKGDYEVMYAFRSRVYSSDEITFKYYQFIDAYSEEEFDSNMEEMDKLSLIETGVTANFGDKLLTLSTCDYQETNGRFVVVAKRIN